MAQADDLDIMIDGFDPQEALRHPSTPQRMQPAHGERPQQRQHTLSTTQEVADEPEKRPNRRRGASETPSRSPRRTNPVARFFADERLHTFLGITLLLLCLFMVIAVISHFTNGASDQSVVENTSLSEMAQAPGSVDNAGGGFGAWLSHALFCDAFGLGSLVIIVYCAILGYALLRRRKCNFWSLTFKCLLLTITSSVVLGFVFYTAETVIYWGGDHGHYVNKFLFDNTTWVGALLVTILLISAVVCVYLNDIHRAWRRWKDTVNRRKMQEELRRERMRRVDEMHDTVAEDPGQTSHEPAHQEPKPRQGSIATKAAPAAEQPAAAPAEQSETIFMIDDDPQPSEGGEAFSVVAPEIEKATEIAPQGETSAYDHRADLSRFIFPTFDLLEDRPSGPNVDMTEQQENKERIVKTLLEYKIPISRIEATVGPTVTLYEIVPAEGVRIAQIKRLEDDIALSLSALGIRIIAPIPGKGTVGIEVPNRDPQTVSMRSIITSRKYQESKMALPMAMGATISNDIFMADLAKMPHLLVAGATGMGKSVGLNAILASLLYKKHPSEMKLVLIDPKMVEFSLYSKLERHYLAKLPDEEDAIITDMAKVIQTLNSLCVEMDQRYALLRDAGVRSIAEYNAKFSQRRLNPEKGHKYLPYIVVVVDEFADLIMTAGKEVETPIARIAQKARAVGMHLIIATQRPSTNVITGIIKANFPARIAFRVSQMVDSKTILDRTGANQLIGKGDMLFSHNGSMERVQCAFISTEEVEAITEHIDNQVGYEHAYYLPEYTPDPGEGGAIAGASSERDAIFDEAARFVVSRQMGSTSSLQRQFGIGYTRAGRLMDQMEAAGIVGPVNGAKARNILVDMMALEMMLQNK